MMTRGGNGPLQDWFRKYMLPEGTKMDLKYKTKAAKFYRQQIQAYAEESKVDEAEPTMEEALEICDELVDREYIP